MHRIVSLSPGMSRVEAVINPYHHLRPVKLEMAAGQRPCALKRGRNVYSARNVFYYVDMARLAHG